MSKLFAKKNIKYIILFAAIGAMAFGIFRGEMMTVLTKAAAICMECIGIG